MAPRALNGVGGLVAREVIKKVVDHGFKKYSGRGRRLGDSRKRANIEEGIKRVVEFGLKKAESSGGIENLVKRGVARTKKEGFVKVAKEVMSFATAGLVQLVNPSGFATVFKPNGNVEFVFRSNPIEGLREPSLQMNDINDAAQNNVFEAVVTKEEPYDWQYCEVLDRPVKEEDGAEDKKYRMRKM